MIHKNHFPSFILTISLLLSVILAVPAMASEEAAPDNPDALVPLHVSGTVLADPDENPVVLRGLSTHGIAWFPQYINPELFQEFHDDWQADVIRLAMYTAESGGYCQDGDREYLKDLLDQGIRYATDAGMYVIVDWHILSDNDPNMHLEESLDFFAQMSERYADQDNILYEICNEPNGGTTWQQIKSYALQVIPVIREADPDAVILIGTPNWSQFVDEAAADPITEYDNLMYTLHFYAATHKQDLRDRMCSALDAGLPIFVSEYSICDASGNGALDLGEAQAWMELLDERGVSSAAWNISNKDESSAIIKPSCSKVSGLTLEDLSDSGLWQYGMLTGETELMEAAPEHADPSGDEDSDAQSGAKSSVLTQDDLEVRTVLRTQWEENAEEVLLYDVTLTNLSEEEFSDWSVTLEFQQEYTLTDSWNGKFGEDGTSLTITPMDYNRSIPAGGSIADIGFIIKGSGGLR